MERQMSDEELRTKDTEYLTNLPEVVPAGKILVHNQGRAGMRGFRAWLAPATERDRYEPCDCGWAPKLGTHYWVTDLSMPGGGPAMRRTR